MEKAGQKFLYPCKLPPTKFYMESNWKFLNERGRPQIPISPQTLSNEIRFRIKLKLSELKKKQAKSSYILANSPIGIRFRIKFKLSEWKKQARNSYISANSLQRNSIQNQIQTFWLEKAGQKFLYLRKHPPTEFYSESNWKILMKEAGRKFLYLRKQTLSNGIRFRIKLNFWTNFDLESSWNFLNEKGRPEYPIFCKLSSTEFDLESNWNFLNEKCRPKILISSQTLLNGFRFRIKLKLSEWKIQAKNSYIFSNSPQRISIQNQIETFWMAKAESMNYIFQLNYIFQYFINLSPKNSIWLIWWLLNDKFTDVHLSLSLLSLVICLRLPRCLYMYFYPLTIAVHCVNWISTNQKRVTFWTKFVDRWSFTIWSYFASLTHVFISHLKQFFCRPPRKMTARQFDWSPRLILHRIIPHDFGKFHFIPITFKNNFFLNQHICLQSLFERVSWKIYGKRN